MEPHPPGPSGSLNAYTRALVYSRTPSVCTTTHDSTRDLVKGWSSTTTVTEVGGVFG